MNNIQCIYGSVAGQLPPSESTYADSSWNSASQPPVSNTSQQPQTTQQPTQPPGQPSSQQATQQPTQQPNKDPSEDSQSKPQQKQPNQQAPAQRPANASQILANIQNPSRSKLAPVSKPPGLDPVAILKERETR